MGKDEVICFGCGAINDYKTKTIQRRYRGDGYDFELEVPFPYCSQCGEPIVIEEIEEEIAKIAHEKIQNLCNK